MKMCHPFILKLIHTVMPRVKLDIASDTEEKCGDGEIIKKESKVEVKQEHATHIKTEIKVEVKQDHAEIIKNEMKVEVKQEHAAKIKKEIKLEVKQEHGEKGGPPGVLPKKCLKAKASPVHWQVAHVEQKIPTQLAASGTRGTV